MKGSYLKKSGFVLALLLLAGGFASLLVVPYGPSEERFVEIPSGSGAARIGALLEGGGVVRSRYAFDLLRLLRGGRLQAGEYRFDHPASAIEVYRRIARGDVYTRTVTVPEGYNIFDIARAVEAAGLGSAAMFLEAEQADTALIADLTGGQRPRSLEGFLYPDTYRFSRHTTPEQMLAAMVRRFRQQTAPLGFGADALRVVTLASIVEKEVGQSQERPLVASVFRNRLAQGMPLQTDPAVSYASMLRGTWTGVIHQSELHSDSAYNTYAHGGLPPGPICSPGLAALKAAMHPASTDYLYFVADAHGATKFSATLAEHAGQVAEYRRGRE